MNKPQKRVPINADVLLEVLKEQGLTVAELGRRSDYPWTAKTLSRALKLGTMSMNVYIDTIGYLHNHDFMASAPIPKKVKAKRHKYSQYAKAFDDRCSSWTPNLDLNYFFLQHHEEYFSKLLQQQGYVFLNEVYQVLGLPRTQAGNLFGWKYVDETSRVKFFIPKRNPNEPDFTNPRKMFYDGLYPQKPFILVDFLVDADPIIDALPKL